MNVFNCSKILSSLITEFRKVLYGYKTIINIAIHQLNKEDIKERQFVSLKSINSASISF